MKKTIIGVILIVVSIAGIIGWEFIGREELMYTDMLVLNQDVESYTQITKDMLASRKIYNPMEGALTVDKAQSIIGKETTQFVAKGSELYSRYFEDEKLLVDPANELVFSVDAQDVMAYPRSIKRGDTVYFYSYDKKVASSTVIALKDTNGNEITQSNNRTEVSAQIASIEFKVDRKNLQVLSTAVSEKEPLTIAYN